MAEKDGGKKTLYIALVAVLLLVIGVLAVMLLRRDGGQVVTGKSRDPNASVGQYKGKTQEEIQAELDKIVEEGMFNISINSNISMARGSDPAELRIENIAANHHLMGVAITLDSTGETIYRSGLIEPGYYIQTASLETVLAPGTHDATAVFTAYDTETEEAVGQAAAKITIRVEG